MRVTLATIAIMAISGAASAQEDIVRPPIEESGSYQMSVKIPTTEPNDAAVFVACCDRVDMTEVIELGCEPRDAEGSQVISFTVDIVKTAGDDAEVKCYSENSEDRSPYSPNSYIMIFPLSPNAPILE